MRRKRRSTHAPEEAVLEALPVYDGDDVVEPEPVVEPAAGATPRALARDAVEAVMAVLAERTDVRSQTPFVTPVLNEEPRNRPATFYATFNRMIALPPARLPGLPAWWQRWSEAGNVRVTRRLSLEQPRATTGGTWRVNGRLRGPLLIRSIPVELLLWPYVGSWTRMSLEPQRGVHAGRFYFRRGHRSLDQLTRRLMTELVIAPAVADRPG